MKDQENADGMGRDRRNILKLALAANATLLIPWVSGLASAKAVRKPPQDCPAHAAERFLKSMNCSQAILETYGPSMEMSVEDARRVAAAFAGGMGMGSECGAVTGAFMVIGMKYGKTTDKDPGADQLTFAKVAEFVNEFKARHTHLRCSDLLGTDMGTPEGVKEAEAKGLFTTACPKYVRTAAEILDKLLV